eukprot:8690259-Alexandrium_andersonii.AAC.1
MPIAVRTRASRAEAPVRWAGQWVGRALARGARFINDASQLDECVCVCVRDEPDACGPTSLGPSSLAREAGAMPRPRDAPAARSLLEGSEGELGGAQSSSAA